VQPAVEGAGACGARTASRELTRPAAWPPDACLLGSCFGKRRRGTCRPGFEPPSSRRESHGAHCCDATPAASTCRADDQAGSPLTEFKVVLLLKGEARTDAYRTLLLEKDRLRPGGLGAPRPLGSSRCAHGALRRESRRGSRRYYRCRSPSPHSRLVRRLGCGRTTQMLLAHAGPLVHNKPKSRATGNSDEDRASRPY